MPYKDIEKRRENARLRQKIYYRKHKKRCLKSAKKYREKYPERVKKSIARWYEKNPNYYKKWKNKNPEKVKKYEKKFRLNNRIKLRNRDNKKNMERKSKGICINCAKKSKSRCFCSECLKRRNLWQFIYKFKALQIISGKRIPRCILCGERDIRLLTKNHRGTPIKKLKKDRMSDLDIKILNGERKINDLEVRCYNCNILHEYERGNRKLDKNQYKKMLKEERIIRKSDKIKFRKEKNGDYSSPI